MALVTVAGFEARLGRTLTGTERTRAEAVLEDASAIVLDEGLETWTDLTVPDAVAAVLYRAARRSWDNPDGATQKSIGDVSVSYRNVEFTAAEMRTIRRAAGKSSTSVTLVSPWPGTTDEWLVL